MTTGVLAGMRIVEGSAFVAAPLGGMTLAQMGADVIRFDQIGGGLDYHRWPITEGGHSLFWAGLNKGKRSIQIDLRSDAGRELVKALVTAPGDNGGIFLTNFPARGWLDYDRLRAERADLIMVVLTGNCDGSSEVDYTVNPATGFPSVTGAKDYDAPVNSVLPAWDIALGTLSAVGLLAGERHRTRTGEGQLINASLSDVAFAMVGNLGRLGQAALGGNSGTDKDGNYLYGAFGAPFRTADGRYLMVVGLTRRQWSALRDATGLTDRCDEIERECGVDLETETGRYVARERIAECLRAWFARRTLPEVARILDRRQVAWGPYQTFTELLDDRRLSSANSMFSPVEHPGVGTYPMPASPLHFAESGRLAARRAPQLGEHTDEILTDILGLADHEIGKLHDRGVVAGLTT
ncbi:mesaconyl-CoA isomerase [Rhodococcus sp. SC4]|uniref:CoA transferase n=1 Tax=Rhodococcus sp. LB1 TaxID=1807499 RepID=UPI00076AD86C|nr:CoA transferase [Rhodococcus sp. LB1]KXF49300.1 mesaconyl-CoA isomerase [Rhodococcus sp. SC4]KXX63098.1 mesaconyl-CoA isomerase [Rhodococcus sp. LB1]